MIGDVASRDSAAELLGRLVDNRYKILEAMASGSMGAVFKAERVLSASSSRSSFSTRVSRTTPSS
jgi:hypothetical protein